MVESALINTFLGCFGGTLAGWMPGTGLLVALVCVYPYLITLDLIGILCFYIGLANLAQFTGSITAIYFGVPGETNSVPSVIEGHALSKQGKGHSAIVGTSLSSVVAGVITVLLLVGFFPLYDDLFQIMYQTKYQALILGSALCIFLLTSKHKLLTLGLMVMAFVVGRIGYNEFTGDYFLTFDSVDLKTGLPIFPIIIGMLVVPYLLKNINFAHSVNNNKIFNIKAIQTFYKNIRYSFLGTVIGFFCGLVPAVSTVLATNVSHKIAKSLSKQQPSYGALISAEASNNSAILVTLVPLILLGIPITGSEAMLLNIMDRNLFNLNWSTVIAEGYHYMIMLSVILSLFLGVLVSWPMSKHLQNLLSFTKNYFKVFVILLLAISLLFISAETGQYVYFTICLIVFSVIGYWLRNIDILPFIFVFLLQNKLESVFVLSYTLYT